MDPFGNPPQTTDLVNVPIDFGDKSGEPKRSIGTYEEDGSLVPGSPNTAEAIGRVIDVESTESKSSGNPMLVWCFVATEGEFAGTTFRLYTVLTARARFKVEETMKALGLVPGSFKRADAIGVSCVLHLRDEVQEGYTPQAKVRRIKPHPRGAGYRDPDTLSPAPF